jgi:hypothetical protein
MKRALIVGIDDYSTKRLKGCLNDVTDIAARLVAAHGFREENITSLLDARATKQAILDGLGALIRSGTTGDHLYFHFSGHGTQFVNDDGQVDELLVPVDFTASHETWISREELREIFRHLSAGVAATCSLDACYAGGVTGLEQEALMRFLPMAASPERQVRMVHTISDAIAAADVVVVSACEETEKAIELDVLKRWNGAFSYHFLHELGRPRPTTPSLRDLMDEVSYDVGRYKMRPVLRGRNAALDLPFLADR